MRVLRALGAALIMLGLVATAVVSQTGTASAATRLSFTKLYADSPGSDHGSNKSLNAEYVVVRNNGSKAVKLGGYKIKDAAHHTYVFPSRFVLKAKKSVTVHTGKGRNTGSALYWGQSWYIWNNTTDTAYLVSKSGSRLDTCKFSSKYHLPYTNC
jgi:hypothetical protein